MNPFIQCGVLYLCWRKVGLWWQFASPDLYTCSLPCLVHKAVSVLNATRHLELSCSHHRRWLSIITSTLVCPADSLGITLKLINDRHSCRKCLCLINSFYLFIIYSMKNKNAAWQLQSPFAFIQCKIMPWKWNMTTSVILSTISFCVLFEIKSHTGLEQYAGD